jgi:hypothetical protein
MKKILRVISVHHTGDYRLYLEFNNGTAGEIDLAGELEGPVFQPLKNQEFFAAARLEGGTVAWPNGADMAPEFLAGRIVEKVQP